MTKESSKFRSILLAIIPVVFGFMYNIEKLSPLYILGGLAYSVIVYFALTYVDSKYTVDQRLKGVRYIAWTIFVAVLILAILSFLPPIFNKP